MMTPQQSRKLSCCLAILVVLYAGCAVGPDYRPPRDGFRSEFTEIATNALSRESSSVIVRGDPVARWWKTFNDQELDSLIARALERNREIHQAVLRLRQARAQRSVVASGLFPEIGATAGYNQSRGSKNVVIPLGGLNSGAGGSAGSSGATSSTQKVIRQKFSSDSAPAPEANANTAGARTESVGAAASASPFGAGGLPGITTELYQAGFDASWEIDIFGGTRRAIESAKAGIGAAEEDYRAVQVSLLAEVATAYINLRDYQNRLEIARTNLSSQLEMLEINQAKSRAGVGADLDVERQAAEVAGTAASIPLLEAAERASMHSLAFLLSLDPDALIGELSGSSALPLIPLEIPVGIPSDLLRRRPDIRRAERRLASATARVGVATADLFPKFNLTGSVGLDSSQAKNLLDWQSHYFAINPGIYWPVLDWGRIRGNIRVQNALQEQAFTTYRDTVAQGLKDVEDALVHFQKEQVRRSFLADASEANRRSLLIARQAYDHGLADMLTVLDAQRSALQSREILARSDAMIRVHLVALYKALGGGWEMPER